MPKRTYAAAFGRRRFTANKRRRVVKARRRPRISRGIRMGTGFPLQKVVKMRYLTTFRLTPGLAATANHFFRCNSIFDPDAATGGHQPYTHDTWAAIYNHYTVTKASCKLVATSTSATPTIVGIRVTDDQSAEQNIDTAMESGKAHYRVNASENSKAVVTHGYNKQKMFRNSGKDSVSADMNANPAEQAYFQLFVRHLNATASGSAIDCLVELNYTVRMWELKDIGQS